MPLTHSLTWTLLAAAGFALASTPRPAAALQKDKKDELPPRPTNYGDVSTFKGMPGGINDLNKAKAAFQAFAKYNAELIAHPRVHAGPQEFRVDAPGAPPPPPTLDAILTEVNRHILVPEPGSKVGPDQADYIRELGIALDAELGKVIREHPERVVRVNAMRMLAVACRSGAAVHYKTVTDLITNANTPPEVRYYALQAAGNLLAAYDVNDYSKRAHSNTPEVVGALVAALDHAVLDPSALVPGLPPAAPGKPAAIPADQVPVVAFIRRQAVKALGQVRFAEFKVPKGPTLHPAFTLARIAVSDPSIVPTPTHPAELADAVIGICGMTPPRGPAAGQYGYATSDAVATGIINFAGPRAGNPKDQSQPWRGLAAKLRDALQGWRPLFDPAFDPTRPTLFSADLVPPPVAGLIAEADKRVLTPMEKAEAGVRVDVDGLRTFRRDLRANKSWTLAPFKDNPELKIPLKE